MGGTHDATALLERMGRGDQSASEELFAVIYERLHELAERAMEGERMGHTLQATALVHEAWIRLVGTPAAPAVPPGHALGENQARFLALAARAMRNVLVDHARRRRALKRGGELERIVLEEATVFFEDPGVEILSVDEALCALAKKDDELARLVELRFFAGLSHVEIGLVLSLSERQVERGWVTARVPAPRAQPRRRA